MWPRLPQDRKLWQQVKGETNRRNFRRLIRAGEVHAVIALAGNEPVGWCSFGPREDFPKLDSVRAIPPSPAGAWSIVCFYIRSDWRQQGLATRLAAAATRAALAAGAKRVEGYPIEQKPGVVSTSSAWTGLPGIFQGNGYEELPKPKAARRLFVKRPKGRKAFTAPRHE
jgi:GNAT superfamily N-acetyltransferase